MSSCSSASPCYWSVTCQTVQVCSAPISLRANHSWAHMPDCQGSWWGPGVKRIRALTRGHQWTGLSLYSLLLNMVCINQCLFNRGNTSLSQTPKTDELGCVWVHHNWFLSKRMPSWRLHRPTIDRGTSLRVRSHMQRCTMSRHDQHISKCTLTCT